MVIRKQKARELAMQVMYLWDNQGAADMEMARCFIEDSTDDAIIRREALALAEAAWEQRHSADRWVQRLAPEWPPHRQPAVDRNLLRLAVFEMINTPTPPRVVIDQAIRMAKTFSTEQSAAFVNGVLDAILKEHRSLTAGQEPGTC